MMTELCRAVKLKTHMNNTELKACPFCERPAKQWQPYAVKSVWKIGCIALGCRVNPEVSGEYDKAVRDWNDRAGGREPAMSKTGGTKGVGMSDLLSGAGLIATERLRQKTQEGYSDEHDDAHDSGEMPWAAICYARQSVQRRWLEPKLYRDDDAPDDWPFEWSAWRPKSPIEDLVRAGALIAAEIDRLRRLKARKPDNVRISSADRKP